MAPQERTARVRLVIGLVCEKWRLAVLHLLWDGTLRTSQLQRHLKDVSAKVLIQTLRGLERDGLVDRKAYAMLPPRVEYRLTEKGRDLLSALDGVSRWAESYDRKARGASAGSAKL